MFYPGDPVEERKRALIAKLSGRGRGGGAGGQKVGRAPGFFGRGVAQGFGGAGQNFGRSIAPGLQGPDVGGGMFESAPAAHAPQFNMGGDIMSFGGPVAMPASQPFIQSMPQGPSAAISPIVRQLLAQQLSGYGGFGSRSNIAY